MAKGNEGLVIWLFSETVQLVVRLIERRVSSEFLLRQQQRESEQQLSDEHEHPRPPLIPYPDQTE